jgi:hypothetical protein
MRPPFARLLLYTVFASLFAFGAQAAQPELPGATGTNDGGKPVKVLNYPSDLRDFRTRSLIADGYFTPDIAFSVRVCPKCKDPYVFGVFPRLTRTPFDSLAAVHQSIEETLRKPTPRTMFSPHAGKMVPRACPYCGEPERDAKPNIIYFCHHLVDTGDDLHIEYTVNNGALGPHIFYRSPKELAAEKVTLPDEGEESFRKAYGCHFSLRAVWNELFDAHWNDDKIQYLNAAAGMWLIFRPEKVSDAAFKEFSTVQLTADKKNGVFNHIESVLKIENPELIKDPYWKWAPKYGELLANGKAECFVCISLPEMRSMAAAAVESRKATLNLSPGKPSLAGSGFIRRGPLYVPISLAPLVKLSVTAGLSLHQAGSYFLGEGCFALDAAEHLDHAIQAALPDCEFKYEDGHILIARDKAKEERRIDLLQLSTKLNPADALLFKLYCERILRFDTQKKRFGNPPLDREISPIGLPAFIERRIRPPEHLIKHNAPGALFEPFFDSDGKRCDLCYTSECVSTVVYVDPSKPQFKDIPDVSTARRIYFAEGATLPLYIDAQDVLRFPGGIPGLVECSVSILCGSDVSSMASEAERLTALADFAEVPDVTKRMHLYAFTTNCAALSPRKLQADEMELLQSRVTDFLKISNTDPGPELNLHFDLPRSQPKGTVVRRKN